MPGVWAPHRHYVPAWGNTGRPPLEPGARQAPSSSRLHDSHDSPRHRSLSISDGCLRLTIFSPSEGNLPPSHRITVVALHPPLLTRSASTFSFDLSCDPDCQCHATPSSGSTSPRGSPHLILASAFTLCDPNPNGYEAWLDIACGTPVTSDLTTPLVAF